MDVERITIKVHIIDLLDRVPAYIGAASGWEMAETEILDEDTMEVTLVRKDN